MLIDASVLFFRPHGPFEVSFYEFTFSRRPLREKWESPLVWSSCASTTEIFRGMPNAVLYHCKP